ncbi:hypothetical protein Caci_0012 [Catenulispora acidiphila DSM 44928]|uniref:Uncharacterized protein n=1 Tax=Catenulispora acidiphila (strain DSM 44928 / JCM 14897 / NBRC 102108 / NRRL B-24433 / ID139908) TaxID=479433 RepID=C7QFM8_CATAD|nr:hypothetical protein [Catenulispora acidiphila]ACU68967.1 hypothetical protein Caci_0012 [Catenulispora acidiphila DSM 44928]
MPRFEFKYASDLVVGDWAQIGGKWVEVLGCATDPSGWTRLILDRSPLPETVVHQTVDMPWSPMRPAGSA